MVAANRIAHRIVVPLDGSADAEQALPYVRALAAPGAGVALVHVLPAARLGGPSRSGPLAMAEPRESDPPTDRIAAAAARLRRDAGLRVECVAAHGDPASAIPRLARDWDADLIAIAGHGWRDPTRRYRGSVTDRVAREAVSSVLFVPIREDAPAHVRRAVVPLDGSARALDALAAAATLAERCGAPLWLIAALDAGDGGPPGSGPDAGHDARDARAEQSEAAQALLEGVGAGLLRRGGSATWRVLDGPPAEAIVGAVGADDLIVIASRRPAAGGWPIGSVTEKVVRFAPVPVLVHHHHPPPRGSDERRDGKD